MTTTKYIAFCAADGSCLGFTSAENFTRNSHLFDDDGETAVEFEAPFDYTGHEPNADELWEELERLAQRAASGADQR